MYKSRNQNRHDRSYRNYRRLEEVNSRYSSESIDDEYDTSDSYEDDYRYENLKRRKSSSKRARNSSKDRSSRSRGRSSSSRSRKKRPSSNASDEFMKRRYASSNRSKVTRYRPRFRLNVGYIILLFIFIYIFICVVSYITRDHVSIYEVMEKSLSENNSFTGIAIRNEETIETKDAGYVTYYSSNGEKVASNNMIFSIDEGGSAYKTLKRNLKDAKISTEDYMSLRNEIDYMKKGYSDSNFIDIYKFKTMLANKVVEINTSVAANSQEKLMENADEENFNINKSKNAGILSYYVDDMSDISEDNINKSMFDKSLYKGYERKSGELLEKNSKVCRIVRDDKWKIVIMLNEEQYKSINDKNSKKIGVTFTKDNFRTNAVIKTFEKDSTYYAILSLDKYMGNYIDERFIDVELSINTASGLKIPNSSIVEKDFYVVPYEYFVEKNGAEGVEVVTYDSHGLREDKFVKTQIYYIETDKDGKKYAYLGTDLFDKKTLIKSDKTDKEFSVEETKNLKGVYNVNKGYCEFNKVDVLYSNSEYSIVKKNEEFGISKFDHIVCDVKTVDEKDIIY